MSLRPTERVYLTRSDNALDSFIVFFFLRGHRSQKVRGLDELGMSLEIGEWDKTKDGGDTMKYLAWENLKIYIY